MFNEIEYLPKAVELARSVLKDITFDYEIIIVDDASMDGAGQMADELASIDNNIKVIHHNKNKTLGEALKTGFSHATKDIIIYTDMDLPFDLTLLKNMASLISRSDIVIGSRLGHRESLLRVVYSLVYNRMINFIFRLKVKDVNFALKIFRREVLNEIELKSEGSFINAEFLAKAKKLGHSIKEVEVEYKPRTYGISRLSTPGVILKILYEMFKFYPEIKFFSQKKAMYSKLKNFYKKISFRVKIYNFIRFKTCPFDLIKKIIPKEGTIVDLGCGTGIFLNLLKQDFTKRTLVGFDADNRKIKVALESLNESKGIDFKVGNIIDGDFSLFQVKCITLIDVLYYLNINLKRDLLRKCFNALDWNGVLIIKDIDKALNLKFFWTFFQEFFAVKVFNITYAEGLYFENRKTYSSLLKECGFSIETFDLSRGYFYPHILYIGKK